MEYHYSINIYLLLYFKNMTVIKKKPYFSKFIKINKLSTRGLMDPKFLLFIYTII